MTVVFAAASSTKGVKGLPYLFWVLIAGMYRVLACHTWPSGLRARVD